MKCDKFEWYKQIKWEIWMREKRRKRERDTLCNVLSTQTIENLGSSSQAFSYPNSTEQTKTGPIQRHREKEQREQSKMGPTVEWSCKRKNLCFFARRKPCEILQKRDSLSSAVAGRWIPWWVSWHGFSRLFSSFLFVRRETEEGLAHDDEDGKISKIGKKLSMANELCKMSPICTLRENGELWKSVQLSERSCCCLLSSNFARDALFFLGFCCWPWGLFSCSHHWTQQSCHDTLALSLTTYLPEFLNCILCSTFVTSTHLESAVQQRVCCLIN